MARKDRVALIKGIEKKRGSKVIVYITSDRQNLAGQIGSDAVPVIERHLRGVIGPRTKRLDLFLYSTGGDANMPWSLVSMIREYVGERPFSVLIPSRAYSAATVIALGADEIVMAKSGELGPIDATIEKGPHNPREKETNAQLPISVEDVTGFFNLLQKVGLEEPSHKMDAFALLANQVHPLALGSVSRLLSQTELVAQQLLKTRREPLADTDIENIIKQLSSEIYSHSHTVRRNEARRLGLKYVKDASVDEIEDDLWNLYSEYAEFFNFNDPFRPNDDMILSDFEEKDWTGLPIACVESTSRKDVYTFDLRVRRLRNVPPTISINMPNLQLAVPPIPDGLDNTQIQAFINQIVTPMVQKQIEVATKDATEKLLKALPAKGFEHVQTKAGWKLDRSKN